MIRFRNGVCVCPIKTPPCHCFVELETNLSKLDNVDYNSLKHEIKVHTTKDQAVAIAIPGQADPALQKFENALFSELSHQHARVDLFVGSKASELHRRLGMFFVP